MSAQEQDEALPATRVPGGASLADGELRAAKVDGRSLVLGRKGEERYACADRCPHYGIRLSEGTLDGSVLTCRWHHWCFDLRTGAVDEPSESYESFETFEAWVDGDDLLVAIHPRTPLRRSA